MEGRGGRGWRKGRDVKGEGKDGRRKEEWRGKGGREGKDGGRNRGKESGEGEGSE